MTSPTKPFAHQSKTQALSEHLGMLARSLGPDAKLPTVQELKRKMGVSIATLDSALAQLESQKVIYRRHGVGIFVSPQAHQKSVGLVCDPAYFRSGTSPFWSQLIEGVRLRAASKDEMFRFYMALPSNRSDSPAPDDLIEDVRAGRVDGALFVGNNRPAVAWICEQKLPVVGFAGWAPHTVALDYELLIRLAVGRLVEQGCQRIGFITWNESQTGRHLQTPLHTTEAFRRILEENGLPFSLDHVGAGAATPPSGTPDGGETNQEHGYEETLKMFGSIQQRGLPPLQGLVVIDDLMTRGVLAALTKLNLRPGQDIQIASHANRGSATLEKYANQISRVEFDPAELIQTMFDSLETLMAGNTLAEHQILIAPRLCNSTLEIIS